MAIKPYDPIIAILRNHLLANAELVNFIGQSIHPTYINSVANPMYPAITICQEFNRTLKNRTGYEENRYYIHGWIKSDDSTGASPDDVAYMHNLVVATLDVHPILGNRVPEFAMCRKVYGKCPLYEKETRTTYFMTEWLIQASKSLMYT